jgi:phosphatidylserine/phosphatidylglycerophosphate/cardiolipin synthase-like enzyme
VIQPDGVGHGLAGWAAEVTRQDFLMGQGGVIGHAIIHSKMIVIDPFTDPVVITGFHNFSQSASSKNDENLLIVKGNKELAERYAVNIMSAYQHYRWRAYLKECVAKGISPWQGLKKSDQWQKKDAQHDLELQFWFKETDSILEGIWGC